MKNTPTQKRPTDGKPGKEPDNTLIALLLLAQGMIAVCVGVGLRMATFGPPRPLIADVAAGVLIIVGGVMLIMSFRIRSRAARSARKPKNR